MKPFVTIGAVGVLLGASACTQVSETGAEITKQPTPTALRAPSNQMELLEERLPVTTLSGSLGSVRGERGSWCWKDKHTDGAPMAACADYMFIDPDASLEIVSGEQLTLAFDRDDDPERLTVFVHERPEGRGRAMSAPIVNPSRFGASFAPGTYWLVVGSWWSDGDAWSGGDVSAYFKIRVS